MQGAIVLDRLGRQRDRVREERDFQLPFALLASVSHDVVHEPRDGRLDPLRLVGVLADERVEDRQRLHVGFDARHAAVVRQGDRCLVRDAGSKFGTFVGKEKVTSRELKNGDTIHIWDFELSFFDPGVPAP